MSSRYSTFPYSSRFSTFLESFFLFFHRLFQWRNVHIFNYNRNERNSIFLPASIEHFQLFLFFHVSKQPYFNFHLDISFKEEKKNKNRFDCNYSKELKIGKRVLLIFFYARRTNYNSIFQLIEEKRAYPTDDRKIDIKTLLRSRGLRVLSLNPRYCTMTRHVLIRFLRIARGKTLNEVSMKLTRLRSTRLCHLYDTRSSILLVQSERDNKDER